MKESSNPTAVLKHQLKDGEFAGFRVASGRAENFSWKQSAL